MELFISIGNIFLHAIVVVVVVSFLFSAFVTKGLLIPAYLFTRVYGLVVYLSTYLFNMSSKLRTRLFVRGNQTNNLSKTYASFFSINIVVLGKYGIKPQAKLIGFLETLT